MRTGAGEVRAPARGGGERGRRLQQRHVQEFGEEGGETGRKGTSIYRSLRHLPVVDAAGRLIGVHLLRELLGAVERPYWAVLMVGGEAT